jgi:hypothetical protein
MEEIFSCLSETISASLFQLVYSMVLSYKVVKQITKRFERESLFTILYDTTIIAFAVHEADLKHCVL